MKVAVRFKKQRSVHGPPFEPAMLIIEVPTDIRRDPDAYEDFCFDEVEKIIGEAPKWLYVVGKVNIDATAYKKHFESDNENW